MPAKPIPYSDKSRVCVPHPLALSLSTTDSDYNGFSFYQNPSCTDNPDLCQWNAVFIPYCTQDLHSGMRSSPSSDSWGLYFTGRYVFDAVVNALLASHNFANATDVIVAGDSAGGIGTWLHVDRLAAKLPHARVVAAPVAGFYFPVRKGRRVEER